MSAWYGVYTPMVEALRGLGYDVLDAKEDLVGSPDDGLYDIKGKVVIIEPNRVRIRG